MLRAVLLALACLAGPAAGQETGPGSELPLGQVKSAVLVVDLERLFVETLFGKRVTAQFNAARTALQEENDGIVAALDAEERSLTERRPAMSSEEFRAASEDFDARVQAIRAAQDAKESRLEQMVVGEQDRFIRASRPILDELMRLAGAVVILDRRFVLDRIDAVDVTEEAIAQIDAQIGDGSALPVPQNGASETGPDVPER